MSASADAGLPGPEDVVSRARETTVDGAGANLVVAGAPDANGVDWSDEDYVGPGAGALGRLAAAVAVDGSATVHFPEPDLTADGPWLVLAPLSGFVSTVAKGTGRATVVLDRDADADQALAGVDGRVSALCDAARPTHDHYPVASDERGVFTTGMTTFTLDSLAVDERLRARFDVSTTPATTAADVESRFADVEGVVDVDYETVSSVERSAPSPALREAVETAHREVVGDCQYEWLPEGDVFAEIPGPEKVALGAGARGVGAFTREEYGTCVDLLDATLSNLEGDA